MATFRNDPIFSVNETPEADAILGESTAKEKAGVAGRNLSGGTAIFAHGSGNGVVGVHVGDDGAGVVGTSDRNDGVRGFSKSFDHAGVVGTNTIGVGVLGQSDDNDGVRGFSKHQDRSGVVGTNTIGVGVLGQSDDNDGVRGFSKHQDRSGVVGTNTGSGMGVAGFSKAGNGVFGEGANNGVAGQCSTPDHSGVWGNHTGRGFGVTGDSHARGGAGVLGRGFEGALAGRFQGNVEVTGNIKVTGEVEASGGVRTNDVRLEGADCAEEFHVCEPGAEPGTVMVIQDDGMLHPSDTAYDTRVAGVVSGAGEYRPGIVLHSQSDQGHCSRPVALVGKVFCKVDASYTPIRIGDMLTTSPTPGHAMAVRDPIKAFGAVIGKALQPLAIGCGLIPILVALQ